MQEQLSPINAAIDLGSNTIHVVVASCRLDGLDILEDKQEIVRIGESVTATGEISPEKLDLAIATLRHYQKIAQQYKAKHVLVVATEAIRKARNRDNFKKQVQDETGLHIQIIEGNDEAALTFLGATYDSRSDTASSVQMGVMDLGGGSLELVTAKEGQISWATSLPIGSGLLHDKHLPSNPPTPGELARAQNFVSAFLHGKIEQRPTTLIVTGGSANSLMLLARRAFKLNQTSNRLTRDDLLNCENILRRLKAEEVAQVYELPLSRAQILLAGLVIIEEVMKYLELNEIHITNHGIREGVLLAHRRYGEHWSEYIRKGITFQ